MEKKFSIIVPVYNGEKYLRECLDSVLNQTFKNYELIIINDGSSDNSEAICKEYYLKNMSKIVYLSKKNEGVSSARNMGLKISNGDYIMFLDSDDLLVKDALEEINKNLSNHDLICYGFYKLYKNHSIEHVVKNKNLQINEIKNDILTTDKIGGYLFNKVFKSEIIRDNKLFIDENIHYCEDLLFVGEYLKFCNNIKYIDKSLYYYRMRKGSVSFDFYNLKNASILYSYESLANLYEQFNDKYNYFCFQYIFNYYRFKKIIKMNNLNIKVNREILSMEKNLLKEKTFKEKLKFFLLKYNSWLYMLIRNKKNKMLDLYE